MIKKLCSVILVLCMLISAVPVMASYEDVNTDRGNTAAELIMGLNIMSPDSETEFGTNTLVKRGEFALYLARLLGYDVTAGVITSGYFADVDTTTLEGAAVELLVNLNVIPKTGSEYNPNDEETYSNAVRMVLNALGYGSLANINGGYPSGYLKVATDNELHKGVNIRANSVISKTDAAIILYNAMFMYPMELGNKDYVKSNKTLLEKVLDLKEISGVVLGCGKEFMAEGQHLAEGYVNINGESFEVGSSNIGDYVGYSVKAYYRDEQGGARTIISFTEKPDQNKTATISVDDDIDVSESKVTYYEGRTKKTVRYSKSAVVIYNGRYYSAYNTIEDLLDIPEGTVTFISNDGTGTANVIKVNEVKHLLVERIDKRTGRMYIKNAAPNEVAKPYLPAIITLDPDETECEVYIDGVKAEFEDIMPGDAISMVKSIDNEDARLDISRQTVTGKIVSVTWGDEIRIDDQIYPISKYFYKEYSVGLEATFAITADGYFLGVVETSGNAVNNYAYVLKTYAEEGEDIGYAKLFTAGGEVVTYQCAESIVVNSDKMRSVYLPGNISKGEIVTYKLNDKGQISQMNRPYDASSRMDYVNETEFVKNWNKSSVRYTGGVMGMSFVTDSTTIFAMPRFDTNKESDYRILTTEDMEDRTYSDVTCYDVDSQGRAGALLIVEDISDSVSMGNSLFFVSKKVNAVNDDGEEVLQITGFEKGEEITLEFNDDTTSVTYEDGWMNYVGNETFDKGIYSLKIGDALQYTIANDGSVAAYRLVYNNALATGANSGKSDYSNPDRFYEDWSDTGSVTKQDFYDDLYIGYGDVQMRYMDYMVMLALNKNDRLSYAGSSSPIQIIDYYRPINLMNASIYVYHVKSEKLELGDTEDVLKSDIVFTRSKKMGQLNEVMVYIND